MTTENVGVDVVEEIPKGKPRISVVILLSVLLGTTLVAAVIGGFLYYRSGKALRAEVLVVKKELAEKSAALDGMKLQIENLSRQMSVLKEYAVAHSSDANSVEGKDQKAIAANQVPETPASAPKPLAPEVGANGVAGKSAPIVYKEAHVASKKPVVQNCELVGKSPEDQATTLKRCVSLIEPPQDAGR